MLEVTELAISNLKSYMDQNNIDSALRVALMQGGWSGPSLGLALDEPKDNDTTVEESDITFLVDNELMTSCGEIKIDFVESGMKSGFSISSKIPVADAGGGCSSSGCSSGGCGWAEPATFVLYEPRSSDRGFFLSFYPLNSPVKYYHVLHRASCKMNVVARSREKYDGQGWGVKSPEA